MGEDGTMDNDDLIARLREEIKRSMVAAMEASRKWQLLSEKLEYQHGKGSAELFIAKRDSHYLKEYMAAYVWHRDNSAWAKSMIDFLQEEAVSGAARVPAQRA